jgi:hypothetical protein
VYCGFVATLKENEGKVTMITEDTDKGVRVVFAAVSKDNVKAAQAIADKAYVMMAGPNHCAVTKAKMAAGSCGDCKSGLDAFAETEVTIEKNDTGATTLVKIQKKEQLEKLHAFFAGLKPTAETKTQG